MKGQTRKLLDEAHLERADEALPPEQFKSAFRAYPSGVAVITADVGSGPVALTISSLFSISAEPPLIGYSLSDFSSTAAVLNRAEFVVVHFIGREQLEIAKLCSQPAADRFADKSTWSRLDTGEPFFPSAEMWIRARVAQRHKAGTATVTIAHAVSASPAPRQHGEERALVYLSRAWHGLGRHSALG